MVPREPRIKAKNVIFIEMDNVASTNDSKKSLISGNATPCSILFTHCPETSVRSGLHINYNRFTQKLLQHTGTLMHDLDSFFSEVEHIIKANVNDLISFHKNEDKLKLTWVAGPLENKLEDFNFATSSFKEIKLKLQQVTTGFLQQQVDAEYAISSIAMASKEIADRLLAQEVFQLQDRTIDTPNIFKLYTDSITASNGPDGYKNRGFLLFNRDGDIEVADYFSTREMDEFAKGRLEEIPTAKEYINFRHMQNQINSPWIKDFMNELSTGKLTSQQQITRIPSEYIEVKKGIEPASWESYASKLK